LLNYRSIKQVVVMVKERIVGNTNNKYLLAYYVADNKLDETKVLHYLMIQLPEYMLRQVFIWLNKLSLTSNGKLDKKALPQPEFVNVDNYIARRNKQEKLICDTFIKIIKICRKLGLKMIFLHLVVTQS
jgi:hypothetical protein